MMILSSLHSFLFDIDDIVDKTTFGHPCIPPTIIVFYVVFSKWIGPALMKHRKPFELKNVLIAYNFFQMLANAYIVHQLTQLLFLFWDYRCLRDASPEYSALKNQAQLIQWHIYLIKFVDLLDAVFFVLRKKNSQITFLHLFHHVVICVLCFFYTRTTDYGYYLLLALTINSFIHIVMYLYYFLAAFGPAMQKYLWWKKYLTTMQIIQFIIILLYMIHGFAIGCEKRETMEISFFVFIFALLLLFLNFYRKSFKTE